VVLIGYHASASSTRGVRAHSFSSASFTGVSLNGQQVSEGSFVAAYAGARGVPVVFVSGDDVAIQELRTQIGAVDAVETKRALGFHSAVTLTPQESAERIHAGVLAALGRLSTFKLHVLKTPITLDVSFKNYMPAELMTYLRAIQRVDAHTIRFVGRDMDEVYDFLEFTERYSVDASP
jgi:D-amino peptidase